MNTDTLTQDAYKKRHGVRPGEIVIEIDNEHLNVKEKQIADDYDPFNPMKMRTIREEVRAGNRNELFEPYSTRKNNTNFIRSRIVLAREEYLATDRAMRGIEYIPGERIHIDLHEKIGRITDGLADPDNEELYLKLIAASKSMQRKFPLVPSEAVEVDLGGDDEAFWNWIFAMRKICDGDSEHNSGSPQNRGCASEGVRRCRPVQNVENLPSREECIRSLQIKIPIYATPEYVKSWDEERKEQDPDYSKVQNGRVVLTPYIAGIKPVGAV